MTTDEGLSEIAILQLKLIFVMVSWIVIFSLDIPEWARMGMVSAYLFWITVVIWRYFNKKDTKENGQ